MKLKEFGKPIEFPIERLQRFKIFIQEAWNKRYSLYDDSSLYTQQENNKQQFLIFDENLIKGRNYIGFICYEDIPITIYPKIFDKNIEENLLDTYLITNLMYWLKRTKRVKLPTIDTKFDLNKENNFLEILIYIFSKHTYDLIYTKPFNC
ncbi:5-methylcytosine restriction system specificity protein McrC, partial [Clostridium tarantellae]